MIKKRCAFMTLLLVLMLIMLPTFSMAETNQAVIDACESVVRVVTISGDVDESYIGSGFAVGPADQPVELIVTNCHVITDSTGNICEEVYVVLDNLDNPDSVMPARILVYDSQIDYAILAIDPITQRKPIALMPASNAQRTEQVYALGFPAVSDSINDNGESLPSTIEDVTITNGVISKTNAVTDGANYIQSDCTINGGNSGGPLITSEGVCIGINTFSAVEGTGTYGAIYIDYIIQELADAEVPYIDGTKTNADEDQPSITALPTKEVSQVFGGMSIGTIALLCALALVLVVSSIFMVKRSKGSKGDAGYQKKAKPLTPEEMAKVIEYTPGQTEQVDFTLNGVSGQFAGSSFPVDGNVYIGRDPSICNIVFDEGTPGISSVHCKIVSMDSQLFISDLDSTYGTYLSDGTKLEPNSAKTIMRGEGFYLGDRQNSFIIQ